MYTIEWQARARQELLNLPSAIADKMVKKVETHLAKDPLALGSELVGDLSGLMRYRYRDYRIIYEVIENRLIIRVIRVGHRKDVYE